MCAIMCMYCRCGGNMRKTKRSVTAANRDFLPWAGERCVDLTMSWETNLPYLMRALCLYFIFWSQVSWRCGWIFCNVRQLICPNLPHSTTAVTVARFSATNVLVKQCQVVLTGGRHGCVMCATPCWCRMPPHTSAQSPLTPQTDHPVHPSPTPLLTSCDPLCSRQLCHGKFSFLSTDPSSIHYWLPLNPHPSSHWCHSQVPMCAWLLPRLCFHNGFWWAMQATSHAICLSPDMVSCTNRLCHVRVKASVVFRRVSV